MKTYLVTGGLGFIGSNYILYLLNKYTDIRIFNLDALTYAGNLDNLKEIENDSRYHLVIGDIRDKILVEKIFKENKIDYLVNFAAESHVDRSISHPDVFMETNILGTLNLLNVARKYWSIAEDMYQDGVKFLQISTDEVYGDLPLDRPDIMFSENTSIEPSSPYSVSKASADMLVSSYFRTYKLPVNITRCSNNYGPYQFPEKLIPLVFIYALKHKKIPVYGNGMQVRDWIYVEDHCIAADLVLRNAKAGEIYNIGGKNERSNLSTIQTIIKFINENIDNTVTDELIEFVGDRKGHDLRYSINPEKIKSELGWEPMATFENGIQLTLKWYYDNMKWIENIV